MSLPACACKGIRTCNLCAPTSEQSSIETSSNLIYIYCDACRQAIRMDTYESNAQCPHHDQIGNDQIAFPLDGIYLVPDFLTENEENNLLHSIDNDIWIPSQSGRLKQDYGIKINFKKQTIKTKYFTGMPMYSKEIIERLQTHRVLHDFQSVELCNLDYRADRGSHIDPHIDDIWIWGERLITINLLSNTILSLFPKEKDSNKIIYIPLPRRWMIVLYGDARYEYKHAIQRRHIQERRLAVTFRELTGKNEKFYEENKELYEKILRISRRFTGISVSRFEKIVNEINTPIPVNVEVDVTSNLNTDFLQSILREKISSLEMLNSSTYLLISDKKYLVKLFSNSSISREQLTSIFNTSELNPTILEQSFQQSHIILLDTLTNQQLGTLLAHWRLLTRQNSWKNPFDQQWFNQQYANLIHQKKNSYPFLLSNLFTCQEQLSSVGENHFEYGLLWNTDQASFYLFDLAITCLMNIDHAKDILHAYEEILPLSDTEKDFLDTFIRLQLVMMLSKDENEDENQLDLLEQFSSNVFCFRNLVR